MRNHIFKITITTLGILSSSVDTVGETIPVADLYYSLPAHSFTLSPDSEYMAFIGKNAQEQMALFAQNLDTGEINSWMGGGYKPEVIDYFWTSSDRLIYQTRNFEGYDGVYSVSRGSEKITKLNKDRVTMFLIDPLVGRESFLVARIVGAINSKSPETLIEIDPVKGKTLQTVAEFAEDPRIVDRNLQLFVDPSLNLWVLLIFGRSSSQWTYRPSRDAEWMPLGSLEDFRVLGLDPSGNGALVTGNFGQDRSGLYRYDLEKKSVGPLVFNDPVYDLRPSVHLVNDVRGRPLGLRYATDRRRTIWFSADIQQIQQLLDQKIPDSVNSIVAADTSRGRFIVETTSDRQPRLFKYLDLEKRSLTTIFQTKPAINPAETAGTETIKFRSRDGLDLHGFLTRPINGDPPYPTVVLAKQGAHRRAFWEFNPPVQFFANRGYAVLQVNNRGSIGYGKHFSSDLLGDLAGMNNDIQDAVRWAIEQGFTDPERVAIVGNNLGGYSAMYAVTEIPGIYKCAIAINGIYDLDKDFDRSAPTRRGPRPQTIDNAGAVLSDDVESKLKSLMSPNQFSGATDAAFIKSFKAYQGDHLDDNLRDLSPLNHAKSIECPVLIVYNPITPSKRNATPMITALERNDVPHEALTSLIPFNLWVEGVDEKGKIRTAEEFDQFYAAIEAFLAENL